jgi:calcineurin-like phosphoesterase
VVSSGNHVWEKREFQPLLEEEQRIVRPANYPPGVPGRGWVKIEKAQGQDPGIPVSWIVINLQGRDFMPAIDCPFRTFDAITGSQTDIAAPAHGPSDPEGEAPGSLKKPKAILLVDFHAESTREKESLAFYLDGRASMVVGTHTHVQTADERILPQGTAYITDLGMTGAEDGIIGMDAQICLNRTRTQVAYRMECAKGTALVRGVIAEIDRETGKAVSIKRISR